MQIGEALNKAVLILKNAHNEAPVFEAGVILCTVIHKDKTYIYAHADSLLSEDESRLYFHYIEKRAQKFPLQYITGNQEFMSLNFKVNSNVLIPRQDTEILVETAMKHIIERKIREPRVLDIGTGSGCIAVSIAYHIKTSRVVALDISEGALKTAYQNAVDAGVVDRILFLKSNLYDGLRSLPIEERSFDIIVSNPPYIPKDEIHKLQTEVKEFEPVNALDGGADGLDFYRRITAQAQYFLKPDGFLAFEVGYGQAKLVFDMMCEKFYNRVIEKDLAQIDRVVAGQLLQEKSDIF